MGKSHPSHVSYLTPPLTLIQGMAPVAHVLFNKFMTFNPKNPEYLNRDRFVLS